MALVKPIFLTEKTTHIRYIKRFARQIEGLLRKRLKMKNWFMFEKKTGMWNESLDDFTRELQF
jgi:hypothetical protein